MSLSRASCSPNASQQSIWASQGGAAEGGIIYLPPLSSRNMASCSPNASQQSILGLPRGAAEGVDTALRGVKSRWNCWFSIGSDQNSNPRRVSLRASCFPNASQQIIWASQGGAAEGCLTGRFEPYLWVFPRRGSKSCRHSCLS